MAASVGRVSSGGGRWESTARLSSRSLPTRGLVLEVWFEARDGGRPGLGRERGAVMLPGPGPGARGGPAGVAWIHQLGRVGCRRPGRPGSPATVRPPAGGAQLAEGRPTVRVGYTACGGSLRAGE